MMKPFMQNIISRDSITAHKQQTLRDVALTLSNNRIGAVPVIDDEGKLCGIVSERDLVRALNEDVNFDSDTAESLMTRDLITTTSEVTSSELMNLMTDHKIRHLPILQDDNFIGIVSIGDVVRRVLDKLERESEQLREFINS